MSQRKTKSRSTPTEEARAKLIDSLSLVPASLVVHSIAPKVFDILLRFVENPPVAESDITLHRYENLLVGVTLKSRVEAENIIRGLGYRKTRKRTPRFVRGRVSLNRDGDAVAHKYLGPGGCWALFVWWVPNDPTYRYVREK